MISFILHRTFRAVFLVELGDPEHVVRLLIAEDYLTMRERIQEFLASEHEVLGAFDSGEGLVGAVEQLRPELVLLDVSMPGMGGFSAAERIHGQWPDIKIIFITQHSEQAYIQKALLLGASGYVLKGDLIADLLPAIREASAGRVFLSPRLAAQ